jgi:hypothetical protein
VLGATCDTACSPTLLSFRFVVAAHALAHTHASLALRRSCIAFYDGAAAGVDLTEDLVIYPINPDSWVCNYLWDSNLIKVPICGGRLAAQVCDEWYRHAAALPAWHHVIVVCQRQLAF